MDTAPLIQRLRERPSDVVALLRESLSIAGNDDEESASAQGSESVRVLEEFSRVVRRQESMDDLVGKSAWATILTTSLPDVYATTIVSQGFFDRSPDAVTAVLLGFAGLCDKLEMDVNARSVAKSLMTRTIPLWSIIWDRCSAATRADGPQSAQTLVQPLSELIYRFSGCYVAVHDRPPPPKSFMPYLGLLLFSISSEDESPQTIVFGLRCISLYAEADRPYDHNEANRIGRSFLSANVTGPIDLEKLVLRFKKTLSEPQPLNYHSVRVCLLVVWLLTAAPNVRSLVDKHGLFEGVNRAMSHLDRTHPDAEDRLRIWDLAQDILRLLHTERLEPGTPGCFEYAKSVRGEDITDHFARGVKLCAEMNGDVIFDGGLDPTARLWQALSDHAMFIYRLQDASPAQRAKPTYIAPILLVDGMRARAREVWWSSLSSLQVVEYRRWDSETDPAKSEYGSIIDTWKNYGNLLGIEENVEKKRHRRDVKHRCAWPGCPLSVQGSSEALASRCSGCAAVYYCGTDCQNGDWKRHRKQCKRLKAAKPA